MLASDKNGPGLHQSYTEETNEKQSKNNYSGRKQGRMHWLVNAGLCLLMLVYACLYLLMLVNAPNNDHTTEETNGKNNCLLIGKTRHHPNLQNCCQFGCLTLSNTNCNTNWQNCCQSANFHFGCLTNTRCSCFSECSL